MYLKRLEIIGFKSFADKIKLDFLPGVTAVVGPNGSGKSNISDALRWVLGEQSIKTLRGSKMDDVIFAGTQYRKPLGLAEVTIVLDNSDHSIPLEFNEISITRKLFRSGESEYLINKSPVRLKDIHELFFDTGLGKDAYSVIGQGKIDSILSVKAEERRMIFEEAAGIIKYKARKQVAEKKLDDTDHNLTRVKDIILELQSQLGPLETQAQLAETYLEFKTELSQLEINYYGSLIQKLQLELDELQAAQVKLTDELQGLEGQESLIEAKIEEERLQVLNLDNLLNQMNEDFFRIQNQISKLTEQINFLHTRLDDIERQDNEYRHSLNINQERKTALLQEQTELSAEIAKIEVTLEADRSLEDQENGILAQINADLKSLEAEEQSLKNELIEVLNNTAALKNKLNSAVLQKNFIVKQVTEHQIKQTNLKRQIDEWQGIIGAKSELLQDGANELSENHKLQTTLSNKLVELEAAQSELEAKNLEWHQLIRGVESKISLLEELEHNYQGYFQGVKSLLADTANERFHSKIHGIVADLIKVKPGMELAIETALGSSIQNVVIDDDQAAQEAIAYLKKHSKGRATFLPLNRVQSSESKFLKYQELLRQSSSHTAIDLLEFAPQYRNVINYLLSQVIVAPDLKTAVQISTKLDRSFRIVTPEGDLVNPGGSITGGSNERQRMGLLSRKREIEDLKKEKHDAEAFLAKGIQAISANKEEIQATLAKLESYKKVENELNLKQLSIQREIETLLQNIKRNQQEYELLTDQINEIQQESSRFETGKEELEQQITAAEILLKQIETKIAETIESLSSKKQLKDLQLQKLSEIKSRLSAGIQELNGKQALQIKLEKQLVESDGLQQELGEKQQALITETETIKQTIIDLTKAIEVEKVNLVSQQDAINLKKTEKEEILAHIRELEGNQRSIRRKNNDYQNQLHRLELKLNQKTNEIANLQNRLIEDYGLEWQNQLDAAWIQPEAVTGRIEDLKTKIRELGPVNPGAIDDYRQVKQRYEFLTSQSEDLIKAKSSLQKVIAEIECTITERFNETFAKIRDEFTKIFARLFEGGHADLLLVEPENPLTSGIEIIAQPPGKKLQSLSLLSGGERAMTAIALLFSILTIKPAPFCILDEIDATLDEANVRRFSHLLEIFSEKLQFIVVTHRRGTMEVANALYGVTMEEMGVSKLISLDLSEKAG